MADLEANFMHLQLMHESLTRFSESFASFLYGLNMNAFCVDFPEVRAIRVGDGRVSLNTDWLLQAPIADSFNRAKQAEAQKGTSGTIALRGYALGRHNSLTRCAEAENEPPRLADDGEMTFL